MKYLNVILLSLFLISCVKENRNDCPCSLFLDFSSLDSVRFGKVYVDIRDDSSFEYRDTVCSEDYSSPYLVEVPQKDIYINVYCADNQKIGLPFVLNDDGDFPQLWLYHSKTDARHDSLREVVVLHKNFCRISLNVKSRESLSACLFHIKSNLLGYDYKGNSVDGESVRSLNPDNNGSADFIVPRQKDNSLILNVLDGESVLRSFALGEYISASGYDWTNPDLEDISITLDLAHSVLNLYYGLWEKTFSFEIEI